MPGTIVRATFQGLTDLQKDLDAVELGLGRTVSAAVTAAAEPIVARARTLTVQGPGPRSARDALPHIAGTIYATPSGAGAQVASTHPGAPVLEYGGTIAPRGVPITFRVHAMAHRAADQLLPAIERDLDFRIAALLREHGLN